MMDFQAMKTETLLLQPAENGWTAVHKKYKTYYGSLACEAEADGVRLSAIFGENAAARKEAVEAALREIFTNTAAQRVLLDGGEIAREAWQKTEDARNAALHRTRADYADVLGRADIRTCCIRSITAACPA